MEQYIRDWSALTNEQQEMAISSYKSIRSVEEGVPCDVNRARDMAPFCRGYWINEHDGYVICNI